jgi:hypothetical protein
MRLKKRADMMFEPLYDGTCSKHGNWTNRYIDECPKCMEEDYYASEDEYYKRLGLCAGCGWFDDSKCDHPKRRKFPFRPRKRSCKYYTQPVVDPSEEYFDDLCD